MSQRYFLTTESTYEALRLAVDGDLGYPTATADSIFTPALQAPRDSLRRIVLAVDTDLPGYAEINSRITPLLANSSAQELTEAEYLAFLTCVSDVYAAASHTHDASDINAGTLNASRLPASVIQDVGGTVTVPGNLSIFQGDGNGFLFGEFSVFFPDMTEQGTAYTGRIGSTSGLVLKTGTAGLIEALAQGTAGQVLTVNSGATGVQWSTPTVYAAVSHAHSVGDISFTATDRLLGRSSSGAGVGEEIVCTSAGRALLDDADAAAQRSTLSAQKAITSGTAAPTGGADGDIYLQYTA